MGADEQQEEREVLDAIFPEEITYLSDTEFRILVTLEPDDALPEATPPSLLLHVRWPDEYPDVAPHLDILSPQPAPAAAHPLFSLADDRAELLAALRPVLEDNAGAPVVFTAVTELREVVERLVTARREEAERRREDEARREEEAENRKFEGEKVTPEVFERWRAGFSREMEGRRAREEEERLAEMKKARVKEVVKLTGRQLWERGLAGRGEDEDGEDDGGGGVADEVEKLKVEN